MIAAPRIGLCVALAVLLSSLAGSAEAQTIGLGRRLGDPSGPRAARRTQANDPATQASDEAWPGPQIGLHYEYFKLADGWGGGDTHSGGLTVFLQWDVPELRTGVLLQMGSRSTARSGDDLVVRGALEVGVQLPALWDPLVPHLSAILTVGGVVGQRFETTVAHPFGGGGAELGATLRVYRSFYLDVSVSYLRAEMAGVAYDLFLFRAGLGL